MSKAAKLQTAAQSAAQVRAYQMDPDVVALRVERVRGWVDRLVWTGIVAGLLFTMANVQHFAARGARPPWEHGGSGEWVIAWLLDPMVSLVLIGVLMGEQIINRHQLNAGAWVRRTKWVALACTYAMNTWSAWAALDSALILLHSVPPVIVVCAAEAITTLRHQITEAVNVAYRHAASQSATTAPDRADGRAESARATAEFRTRPVRAEVPAGRGKSARAEPADRSAHRAVGDPAGGHGGEVDRPALVGELADQIRDAVHAGEQWRPDYQALMERTGFKRRWCEESSGTPNTRC